MIVLDENFDLVQREQWRRWRIRTRQIGGDFGRKGLKDLEIIDFLHGGRRLTFFSMDRDYYRPGWCHPGYCLIFLDVPNRQEALYVRRLLHHPRFDTTAKRLGHVVRVNPAGLVFWRLRSDQEEQTAWP
ncbi:MAG: hypothetical protein ACRDJE_18300 [Dehalococcoidia bacterium]